MAFHMQISINFAHQSQQSSKLIRRWDSERERRTWTTK